MFFASLGHLIITYGFISVQSGIFGVEAINCRAEMYGWTVCGCAMYEWVIAGAFTGAMYCVGGSVDCMYFGYVVYVFWAFASAND